MADKRSSESSEVAVDELMEATKVIVAAVAHSLADVDGSISVPALRILVMISARERLNLSAVAEGLGVNASNASRAVDRLVVRGLVDRREDQKDRRHVSLTLTPAGQRLVDAVMRRRTALLEQVVLRMSPSRQQQLTEALREFRAAADEATAEAGLSDGEGHLLRWLV